MNTLIKAVSVLSAALLIGSNVWAANSIGNTSAQILEIAPDARTTAMGETFCGVADDVNCLHYNPAGLAVVENIEVPLANTNWMGMTSQYMGLAWNLHDVRTVNVIDMGTLAFTFHDLNSGPIDGRDALGNAEGNFSARDQAATLAYGKRLFESGRFGTLMGGMAVTFVNEEIKDVSGSGKAFDLGLLWQAAEYHISAGAALQHFGPGIRVGQEDFDLPTAVKAGVSVKLFAESLMLGCDVTEPKNMKPGASLGAEYCITKAIALRLGYNSKRIESGGLSAGFGLSLKQMDMFTLYARDVDIDYAFIPSSDLGDTHKLSLTLKLGAN